jgi:hypothetical protein
LNIVFDLGGVVVRWEPEVIIADAFDDLEVRRIVHSEFVGHPDWLERGYLTLKSTIFCDESLQGLPRSRIRLNCSFG